MKNLKIATATALATMPLSGFFTDIYLPSMPDMAIELGCTPEQMQLTVTLFLLCYAISQLMVGGFLDAWGRYRPSLVALGVLLLSSLAIVFVSNIYWIYFFRLIQGLAAGVAASSKRSFFVDVYTEAERKNYLSLLSVAWSIGPIIAPFIGGMLAHSLGWRSNFLLLALFAGILLVLELKYSGETIVHKHQLQFKSMAQSYLSVLKTPDFRNALVMISSCYGLIFIFTLSGAFIIETTMGYSAVVAGNISLMMGVAWMTGGVLGKSLINYQFNKKIVIALMCLVLLVGAMILVSLQRQDIVIMTAFAFFIHTGVGFVFNNLFAYCIGRFPEKAGVAGGIASGGNSLLTSVMSYAVVKSLDIKTQFGLALGYATMVALCTVCFVMFLRSLGKEAT